MHFVNRGVAEVVEDSKPAKPTKQESLLDPKGSDSKKTAAKKTADKKTGKKSKKASK